MRLAAEEDLAGIEPQQGLSDGGAYTAEMRNLSSFLPPVIEDVEFSGAVTREDLAPMLCDFI